MKPTAVQAVSSDADHVARDDRPAIARSATARMLLWGQALAVGSSVTAAHPQLGPAGVRSLLGVERSGPAPTLGDGARGDGDCRVLFEWLRQAVVLVARPRARRERQGDWLWRLSVWRAGSRARLL